MGGANSKYKDEQIIEYLRTLREGDVLTAVGNHGDFTMGKRYTIEADDDGDLYVTDDSDCVRYIFVGDDFGYSVLRLLNEGTFEIPTQTIAPFYASIRQIVEVESGGIPYKSVTVRVDSAGFAELEALEARSFKSRTLAALYAQRAEIQTQIDELEAV